MLSDRLLVLGSPVSQVEVAIVPLNQLQIAHPSGALPSVIRKQAQAANVWNTATRLEKEDGVYVNRQQISSKTSETDADRPDLAKGKSWGWCLWEADAAVDLILHADEALALVARVGEWLVYLVFMAQREIT